MLVIHETKFLTINYEILIASLAEKYKVEFINDWDLLYTFI